MFRTAAGEDGMRWISVERVYDDMTATWQAFSAPAITSDDYFSVAQVLLDRVEHGLAWHRGPIDYGV
jgi:hypothetical protein